jgi:uncharacterized protein (TIGR03083 family)
MAIEERVMSNDADQVIDALHAGDDELAPVVAALSSEQLTQPSAASEWSIAQVLSHLGSGAVISRGTLEAALAGDQTPDMDANKAVWARWDAMSPDEHRSEYARANAELLARYDAIDAATRAGLRIDLGFLPEPVDLATAAKFRLSEFALHSWDVRVALDPTAVVHPAAVPLLLDQVGMMLGWVAKPAALDGRTVRLRVELSRPDRVFGVTLGESSSLVDPPDDPDAVLRAPAEAWLRLVTGRLAPDHTPDDVDVSGDLDLTTLRQVFPGY